ncbi:MAG: cupin domain-containing protein [Candidatus Zambryskibacteria bacterium]|nr:cupin domain-containing protein [Candidatus Zambryskibacteria bacterium]
MIYVDNIEKATLENDNFRKVLNTASKSQLVVMAIQPGEDIGMEVHDDVDQFIRIEEGKGKAVLDDKEYEIVDDFAVVIPAGTKHNIVNTGDEVMKLYTIYTPPEHAESTIHKTKAEAEADDEHYER